MDFALTENNGIYNLNITEEGIQFVQNADLVRQRILFLLHSFLGTYIYNRGYGIPYEQVVFTGAFQQEKFDQIMLSELGNVQGVSSVLDYQSQFDNSTNVLSIRVVVLAEGEIVEIETTPVN